MAQNALKPVEPAHISTGDADLFSDPRIELVRQQIAKDAPENLFRAMIELARVRGLDPLAKQISLIRYGNEWQVTTTIDGYRAIAESTGTYAGSDEPVFGPASVTLANKKSAPEWASVTVWKLLQGQRVPFTAKVYWDEYASIAHPQSSWNRMPRTMLAKVAESHALRKGFPKVLSGLYTGEEMDQAGPVVDAPPPSRVIAGKKVDTNTGEILEAETRPAERPARSSGGNAHGHSGPFQRQYHALGKQHGKSDAELHDIACVEYGVESRTQIRRDDDYERLVAVLRWQQNIDRCTRPELLETFAKQLTENKLIDSPVLGAVIRHKRAELRGESVEPEPPADEDASQEPVFTPEQQADLDAELDRRARAKQYDG